MAVALAQAAISRYDGSYGTALTLSSVGLNNLLVLFVSGTAAQTVTGVDTTGSVGTTGTWTQAGSYEGANGNCQAEIWYAVCTGAGNISVKPTGSASDAGYSLHEYSGCATASIQEGSCQSSELASNATTGTSGTIATSVADSLFVAMMANESGDMTIDWTYGSLDFTQRTNESAHTHKTADAIVTSTGTYGCGVSFTATYYWEFLVVCFKGAVASVSIEQEGFRFRNDDGSESAATWKANQDTNITLASDTAARVRMLLNATGDPASIGAQAEYRYKPSGGAFGSWAKVN